MALTAGTWETLFRYKDGTIHKRRALYNGEACAGTEERLFNKDGSLQPLPNGRTSLADTQP